MSRPLSNQFNNYQNNNFDDIQKENDMEQPGDNNNSGISEDKNLLSDSFLSEEENKKNNNNDLGKQCTESNNSKQDIKENESNGNATNNLINVPKSNGTPSKTKTKKTKKNKKNSYSSSNSKSYIKKNLVKKNNNKKILRIIFTKKYKKCSSFVFINNRTIGLSEDFENLEFNLYVNDFKNNSPEDIVIKKNIIKILNISSNQKRLNVNNTEDDLKHDYLSSSEFPLNNTPIS